VAFLQEQREGLSEDVLRSIAFHTADGNRLLGEGRPAEAVASFREADRLVTESRLRNPFVYEVPVWLGRALRLQAAQVPAHDPATRERLLREAALALRRGRRAARRFCNNLPLALREEGLLAAARGFQKKAHRLLGKSVQMAEEREMWHERALSLLSCGRVGQTLGRADAAEQVAEAEKALSSLGAFSEPGTPGRTAGRAPAVTLSLADRFTTVLEAGRRVASALNSADVYEAAREASEKLLRTDQCLVLQAPDAAPDLPREEAKLRLVAGSGEVPYDRSFAERARRSGQIQVYTEGASDEDSDAMILAGVRSALCAPIFVRGRAAACLYASHGELARAFGDEEVRLAAFIATLAGAALENAQGYAELDALSRTLEQRVADRTIALARSNQDLEQFAYVASHDLQEPLRIVASSMRLLAGRYKDRLDEDANEFIEYAVDGAQRMHRLINDLLRYSRVGTQGHGFEIVDMNRALDEALNNLRMAIKDSEADVVRDDLPSVYGDATQLVLLLQNLVGNAIKFQGEAPPRVQVRAEQVDSAAEGCPEPAGRDTEPETIRHGRPARWRFAVEDNGIGIGPEFRKRIFVIFQRLHRRDEYPGTGIGLALCKRIVERHGGQIWVESEHGKGSTFYFTIPEEKE